MDGDLLDLRIKRVYDPVDSEDGFRVLIDRLWPRGLSKEKAKLDLWLKEIAPSTELRQWFNHDPAKWPEFRQRYFSELDSREEEVKEIRARAEKGRVTLLYAARDTEHNQALVLRDYLQRDESSHP